MTTKKEAQGKGYASILLNFVKAMAVKHNANLYVLAIEESCPYWMEKGFILDEVAVTNARLNIFPDTHLLKLRGTAHTHIHAHPHPHARTLS